MTVEPDNWTKAKLINLQIILLVSKIFTLYLKSNSLKQTQAAFRK